MKLSYIYSKRRLQIIRWNKSREASTEDEEKQKGLNVGKRTTWYDRSLTTITLYSMTNLSHPSYYTKQNKKTNRKGLDVRKTMTRYCRSLTPTIAYDTIGLSHPSYYNKTKKTNKKKELDIRSRTTCLDRPLQ